MFLFGKGSTVPWGGEIWLLSVSHCVVEGFRRGGEGAVNTSRSSVEPHGLGSNTECRAVLQVCHLLWRGSSALEQAPGVQTQPRQR